MDELQLRTRIANVIESVILTPVANDTLLMESGLVDSLAAVDVALSIEREFKCRIPASEIDVHMASVESLASFITSRQPA